MNRDYQAFRFVVAVYQGVDVFHLLGGRARGQYDRTGIHAALNLPPQCRFADANHFQDYRLPDESLLRQIVFFAIDLYFCCHLVLPGSHSSDIPPPPISRDRSSASAAHSRCKRGLGSTLSDSNIKKIRSLCRALRGSTSPRSAASDVRHPETRRSCFHSGRIRFRRLHV